MCSKIRDCIVCSALVALVLSIFSFPAYTELVDCLVAVVNNEAITLSDLKIIQSFQLAEIEGEANTLLSILEKVVDMKVVIGMARERISVKKEKSQALFSEIMEKLGREEMSKRLDIYGLSEEDIKAYVREKILFQEIISQRFGQRVMVSLKEIESYYHDTYVPSHEAMGQEPRPMMQVLDEIETMIKRRKTEQLVKTWIENLRMQSDIHIRYECLPEKSR